MSPSPGLLASPDLSASPAASPAEDLTLPLGGKRQREEETNNGNDSTSHRAGEDSNVSRTQGKRRRLESGLSITVEGNDPSALLDLSPTMSPARTGAGSTSSARADAKEGFFEGSGAKAAGAVDAKKETGRQAPRLVHGKYSDFDDVIVERVLNLESGGVKTRVFFAAAVFWDPFFF